jgi:hypothetical protein
MIYVQGGSTILDPGILESFIPFAVSATWVAPFTGYATFLAFGAGGGGSAAANVVANGLIKATGGGAGATCMRRVQVTQGQTFTLTVGAAGAAGGTVTTTAVAGANGGASSVVGSGVNMIAGGGFGGLVGTGTGTLAGGAGGIATGGDVNWSGSEGGSILNIQPDAGAIWAFATAGGASNLFNILNRGANITNFALPAGSGAVAGGGAGVNGTAQDLGLANIVTFPPSYGGTNGSGTVGGVATGLTQNPFVFGFPMAQLFTTATFGSPSGGNGGSGESAGVGGTNSGGLFASGGAAAVLKNGSNGTAGLSGLGAGGSAAAGLATFGTVTATSRAGGAGLILIRLTKSN